MNALLALMPVLVILAFRTLCTLKPAPVPTYLEKKHAAAQTMWWSDGLGC